MLDVPTLPVDCIAVGDLYKLGGSKGGRKTWKLRKFFLAGHFLIYYDKKGQRKGQWDIRNCVVRKISPEECQVPEAIYAFGLENHNENVLYVMCASNEKCRVIWMRCIMDQIQEFRNEVRIHLRRNEFVLADEIVQRNGFFINHKYRILVTNYPKIMLIDIKSNVLKDQRLWTPSTQPEFILLSEFRFKLKFSKYNEVQFEDIDKGAAFWESIFRRLVDFPPFQEQVNTTEVIDLHKINLLNIDDEKDDNSGKNNSVDANDNLNQTVAVDGDKYKTQDIIKENIPQNSYYYDSDKVSTQINASMEIGDLELNATNVQMIHTVLGNIRELVTVISHNIVLLDEEDIDFEFPSDALSTLQQESVMTHYTPINVPDSDLINSKSVAKNIKKQKLFALKDKISKLSTTLEHCISASIAVGIKNIDMDVVESIETETSAILTAMQEDSHLNSFSLDYTDPSSVNIIVPLTPLSSPRTPGLTPRTPRIITTPKSPTSSLQVSTNEPKLLLTNGMSFNTIKNSNNGSNINDIIIPIDLENEPSDVINQSNHNTQVTATDVYSEHANDTVKDTSNPNTPNADALSPRQLSNAYNTPHSDNNSKVRFNEAEINYIQPSSLSPANSPYSISATSAYREKVDLVSERQKLRTTLPDDLKALKITKDNFNLETNKRPVGWAEVKLKRVIKKEEEDLKNGMDQETIKNRRALLENAEEMQMIFEVSVVAERIKKFERNIQKNPDPVFPKAYAGSNTVAVNGTTGLRTSPVRQPIGPVRPPASVRATTALATGSGIVAKTNPLNKNK